MQAPCTRATTREAHAVEGRMSAARGGLPEPVSAGGVPKPRLLAEPGQMLGCRGETPAPHGHRHPATIGPSVVPFLLGFKHMLTHRQLPSRGDVGQEMALSAKA